MKLHLPIALLTAILSATGITRAAEFGAGTYTYTTDSDGTINSTFIGDCTAGSFGTTNQGYKKAGWVAGIPVSDTDRYAPHTNVTIGDGTTATRVNAAIAVGVRGYASDGNKSITVLNNAYAGTIYGAYNLNTGHNSGLKVQGAESYYSNGKYFAPKATKDKVISITLDGGSAVQVYGGMSQLTTPLPAEMKAAYKALGSKEAAEAYALNDPAWALNEKVEINIINGKVGVTADGNGHSTLISNPTANAITGAGMAGASINNTVSINVDGEDSVVYGSIYAGASEFTNTSYDATTYGRIRGYVENTKVTINNGTINGSVHGGGMEGGLVKKDTRVTLAGGQINGDVYGAGSGDEVAGNTQVVIKGEGATVTGTIYGGGSNNAVVNGDRILTFDSYTANPDADGYATVDWNKYQDFNSLELQNSKVNLGQVGTEYESLKLCGSQAIADSVRNGEAVKLDMTSYLPGGTTATIGSSLTVNSNIQLAEGSRIWGSESVSIDLGGFVLNADESTSTLTANSITGTDVYARYGNLTATKGAIDLQNSEIEHSDLIAEKGAVALTDSTVTASALKGNSIDISDSTLTDTDITSDATATQQGGSIRLYNTTMNGGDITVGKYINSNSPGDSYNGLHNIEIWNSNVTADSLKGADGAGVHLHFVSNSTKSSLTVKDDLVLEKYSEIYGGLRYADGELTGLTADITAKSITAAEHIYARDVNMTATEGDISLTDSTIEGAFTGSTLTAENGNVVLNNCDVTDTNVVASGMTMKGGSYANAEDAQDSIKNLHLTDSAVYKNNGTANIDLVTANTNATNYTNEAQLVNNGDMVIGNIWNIQTDYDSEDSLTPNGSLTIKNTEQGNLKVTGSIVDMGSGVDLVHSGGTVDFAGADGSIVGISILKMEGKTGQLVHSGEGVVNINHVFGDFGAANVPATIYTVNQTGTGELNFNGIMMAGNSELNLNQTAAGTVKINGHFFNLNNVTLSGGGTIEKTGESDAVINSITATGEGGTVVNSGSGNLNVLGEVKDAVFEQTGTGTLRFSSNMSGEIYTQTAGVIEFAGAENTVANVSAIGDGGSMTGKLVHSGSGVVNINDDIIPIDGDYTVEQTGNGEMNINGVNSFFGSGSSVKQTGKGTINIGQIYNMMGPGVSIEQNGGGTVAVWSYGDLASLTVEGNSTFHIEKGASVSVETLALSDATLSFTEGADALTISASGAITALDGVMFELILGESAAPLFEGGPDTTVDFSFTVLDGLANLTAGEDLVTAMQQAFTVEQLQLLGANANGAVYDLIIQDATMEYTNGAVTISGKASIPEPTTATLSLLALAALAARRRRASR